MKLVQVIFYKKGNSANNFTFALLVKASTNIKEYPSICVVILTTHDTFYIVNKNVLVRGQTSVNPKKKEIEEINIDISDRR